MAAPTTWSAPAGGANISGITNGARSLLSYVGGYWFCVTVPFSDIIAGGNVAVRYTTDPTGTWSTATMPSPPGGADAFDLYLSRVDFDGTYYAFTTRYGAYSRIVYCTDPSSTWTAYEYDATDKYYTRTLMYDDNSSQWVMAGQRASTLGGGGFIGTCSSLFGTWTYYGGTTLALPTNNADQAISSIDYGGGNWAFNFTDSYLGAFYESICTSTSITGTWSRRTKHSNPIGAGLGAIQYNSIHDEWTVVATSSSDTPFGYQYQSDPTSEWTAVAPGSVLSSMTNVRCIAESPDYWVIVGGGSSSPQVGYLATGTASVASGSYTAATSLGSLTGPTASEVRYGADYFVLVGYNKPEIRVTYVGPVIPPTYLRQRQSPVRAPSRVRPYDIRNRQTPIITK